MVALSRCLGALALFAGAGGARIARKRAAEAQKTKFIAGVPVLEYHAAYGGSAAALVDIGNTQQEWIVFVQPGTTDAQVQGLCGMNKNGCNIVGHPTGGVPFVEMRATEADLEHLIKGSGGVVHFIEPDQEESLIPDLEADMEAATWGLNRIGADSRGKTGSGATIYVQDTGVRVTHVDFEGRAAPALDVSSGSPVECNGGDSSCARDRHSHGTHCAGTAGGKTYGVASSAQVRAVKTLTDGGSGQRSWQFTAIDWVTVNGDRPAVISMSLGGSGADPGYTTVIDAAVNQGVVVVVAAGNSNSDACNFSPAFADNAITVGSTTSTDGRSYFSNYGQCVDIWAPGSSVLSAGHFSDTDTDTKSGTSMACPHVSGAAAILLGANPNMKPSAVLRQMLDHAELDVIKGLKTGDTNALLNLVELLSPTPNPAPTPPPASGSWVVTGSGCELNGDCISSSNHPANYGNGEQCSIQLNGAIPISVQAFDTETNYDYLTVGGVRYSGTNSPQSGSYTGVISWSSDSSVTKSGWKLCKV